MTPHTQDTNLPDTGYPADADVANTNKGLPGKLLALLGVVLATGFVIGALFASWTGLGSPDTSLFDEDEIASVFASVNPAVVEIEVAGQIGSMSVDALYWGSGFLIDDQGHIVTNYHVVSEGSGFIVGLSDGRELEAERVGFSRADDLAVLRVDPELVQDITPLELADSSTVEPGHMAIAVGSPFKEFNSISVGVISGVERGQVSAVGRPIPNMIQTDVPLNPGNSGGPLLNSEGEVVGVNTLRMDIARASNIDDYRIGFAVSSNTVRDVLPNMLDGENFRRPWIGISGMSVSRGMTRDRGLPSGILVTAVFADSPARRAGINPFRNLNTDNLGDVITAVDSVQVEAMEDMVSYLNEKRAGDSVTLTVFRDGIEREVRLALDPWPDRA